MSTISEQSAYVILINDDNSMTISQKRRIVQRSKLVDDIWFLVRPEYNGYNMAEFTVLLEYLSPVSHKYRTEILSMRDDMYEGYLKYTLPIDTELTMEAGEVELMLTFLLSELSPEGKSVQRVRKVSGVKVDIIPLTAWSDIIPDSALSALDQRIIKTDAQIKALSNMADIFDITKADDLIHNTDEDTIQLSSNGTPIGRIVHMRDMFDNGIPVIELDNNTTDNPDQDDGSDDSVVEF